jgi:hypothetical protein
VDAAPIQLGATWEQAGLSRADLEQAAAAVASLATARGHADACAPYAAHLWPAEPRAMPTLHLDDISVIPFLVNVVGVEQYQHRARIRAADGDLFAGVTPEAPGYDRYCSDVLGLGSPEFVRADPVGGPMEVALACAEGRAFQRLVRVAREGGGLAIHPYMGSEPVWELARKLSQEAGVEVPVCAPPSPVLWMANDKSVFSEVVTRVLDSEWVVETLRASDPTRMAEHLLDLRTRHSRAGLKRTRCASGMGNAHFSLAELSDLVAAEALVREFLQRTEWDGEEEVLLVAWEDTPISPSTQLWIPPPEAGPPRLDGIYEQLLEGSERVFLGSRPSQLPAAANVAMGRASLRVGAAFQALGYVGRCSFDLLLLGDPEGEFRLRFTECNGRWGGTSAPMHLVDRLVRGPRPPYRAQDVQHDDLVGASMDDVLKATGDALFCPQTGEGTFVFYNVNPLAPSGKLDVIAFGRTQREAEEELLEGLPRRLGLK